VEDQIDALQKAAAPTASSEPGAGSALGAGLSSERSEEVDDLREVLRLGRHLLEGRQVTL
jgi:hypothetical protein